MNETVSKSERFRNACARIYIYAIDRLNEPSSMRGLVMAIAGLGAALEVAKVEHIIIVAMLVVGALGALLPDRIRKSAAASKAAE